MKRFLFLFAVYFFLATSVSADSRSDFEYQYSKYREHFVEFSLFKKDYLATSTLDNQQKALLTAKQTINTRELTKASLTSYVRYLISQNNAEYAPLVAVNQGLLAAQQYFLGQAAKGLSIVTLADLNSFDEEYSNSFLQHETSIKVGIVAQKIAKVKSISVEQQKSLDLFKNKVSDNVSVRVTERIESLENNLVSINEKIDSMATYLISKEGMENTESEIFFSAKVEQLSEIRSLQLNWVEQLIDLDLNYGKI